MLEGTAGSVDIPGRAVGAKTGTAQNPHGKSHAWIVAAAPVEAPEVVVAVVIENAGSGGQMAGPVAREVLTAWMGHHDAGRGR